jgi:hypothetical protein
VKTHQSIVLEADQNKCSVLASMRKHYLSFQKLSTVTIHYNGHATIRYEGSEATDAGQWIASNEDYIGIDEILRAVDEKAQL